MALWISYLARLPEFVTPCAADRLPSSEVGWAALPNQELFPAPLDLESLDLSQAQALRTWFTAHVNILPPKGRSRRSAKKVKPSADFLQLNLLD
jgi:deoxyribodipyrimidine photo-lyase